jgi:hypothetical protein
LRGSIRLGLRYMYYVILPLHTIDRETTEITRY